MTEDNVTKLNITKNLVEIAELQCRSSLFFLLNHKGEEKEKFQLYTKKNETSLVYSNGSQESEQQLWFFGMWSRCKLLLGVDFSDKQFRAEFGSDRVSSGVYWTQPSWNT